MVGLAAGLEATGVLNVVARIVLGRGSTVWIGQVGLDLGGMSARSCPGQL